jgi:hypothetical protein
LNIYIDKGFKHRRKCFYFCRSPQHRNLFLLMDSDSCQHHSQSLLSSGSYHLCTSPLLPKLKSRNVWHCWSLF